MTEFSHYEWLGGTPFKIKEVWTGQYGKEATEILEFSSIEDYQKLPSEAKKVVPEHIRFSFLDDSLGHPKLSPVKGVTNRPILTFLEIFENNE